MTQARYAHWHNLLICKECSWLREPERNRSTQWKVLLLVTCESVLPIISKPQGALLLFSLSSLGFAPFSATHTHTHRAPAKQRSHPFSHSQGNHLCPNICLQIRPWHGQWLLLFPATSLHKWLSPFTHKKETSDTRWLCAELLFAIGQRPSWRQPSAPFALKKPHYLANVQSGFLSHPSYLLILCLLTRLTVPGMEIFLSAV